jgi:hypothetical protein
MARAPMRQEGSVVGAANANVVITIAAPAASMKQILRAVGWSYDDDPTGGRLTIHENTTERVWDWDITASGPGFLSFPDNGWETGQPNHNIVITLYAGGQGVTGKLIAIWETEQDPAY